jgi:hypothetical protein
MRPARATPEGYSTPLAMIWTPWFLRAIRTILSFGISEIRREHALPIPTKMPTKWSAGVNFYVYFQCATKIFPKRRN